MEISLLHTGLAAGAALAAVPFILHLIMRPTPKHIVFPALRLIKERSRQSTKKLKIKNWLLLLMRMALFALMALALARPSINTETPLGDQEVDTAMAIVIDTSLSMQYTERGNDRLTEAKNRANEILKKATDRSEIFVIDTADPVKPAPSTPSLARKRVDALTLRPAARPLNASILQAYAAVGASKLPRRDVYVLSDLAQSAWELGSTRIAETLEKQEQNKATINTFLLRLTPKDIQNFAVVSAEPASAVAPVGEAIEIKGKIRSFGQKGTRVVKLDIDGASRGQKPIELAEGAETEVAFLTPPTLGPGLHQGSLSLGGGSDFMEFDDVRYFTFMLEPALRVLLVAPTANDALFVKNALEPDPATLPPGTPQLYKVERTAPSELASRSAADLNGYAAIFLLNVPRVDDGTWDRLNGYVRQGGGLVIALGDGTLAASYNSEAAARVMPARLDSIAPRVDNGFLGRFDAAHPLFVKYAKFFDADFPKYPIYRHWVVEPQGGRPCLWYNDNAPALIERAFEGTKTGHVLLWTTPLSRRPENGGAASWSEFPLSFSFFGLMLESAAHLSGSAARRLNYEAGQDVVLNIDPTKRVSSYAVTGPDKNQAETVSASANQSTLVIPESSELGQWRVKGKSPDGAEVVLGYSVNFNPNESYVTAASDKELEQLFGKPERFHLADDASSLKRAVEKVIYGQELFPWLMMLILVLVTLENLLANRFHRETVTSAARPTAGSAPVPVPGAAR